MFMNQLNALLAGADLIKLERRVNYVTWDFLKRYCQSRKIPKACALFIG